MFVSCHRDITVLQLALKKWVRTPPPSKFYHRLRYTPFFSRLQQCLKPYVSEHSVSLSVTQTPPIPLYSFLFLGLCGMVARKPHKVYNA
jgi:hypothetical protein